MRISHSESTSSTLKQYNMHTLELEAAIVVVNLLESKTLGLPPITHQYFRQLLHSVLGLCKHRLTTTTSLAGQCKQTIVSCCRPLPFRGRVSTGQSTGYVSTCSTSIEIILLTPLRHNFTLLLFSKHKALFLQLFSPENQGIAHYYMHISTL